MVRLIPMKVRSFFSILIAFVLILLLSGIGGAIWITTQSPLSLLKGGGVSTTPAATMFVSQQAPLMVSLLVNPERLITARQVFTRPGQRRRAAKEIERLRQGVLSGFDLNYRTDVQPWLGDELTLAVTTPDLDRDRANGTQPGYLLALSTIDPVRSQEFLRLFWQQQAEVGTDLVFEQYAGVKLIYRQEAVTNPNRSRSVAVEGTTEGAPETQPGLASAAIGDQFVLFANHPKILRAAIANVQAPDLSLEKSEVYQAQLQDLPEQRVGLLYGNLPELADWLGKSIFPTDVATVSTATEPKSTQFDRLIASIGLSSSGLQLNNALLTAPGEELERERPALAQPSELLCYMPADSLLLTSGRNLGEDWHKVSDSLQGYTRTKALLEQVITTLKTRWNLDAETELFNWTQGEFAFGLRPRTDSAQSFDWILVTERQSDAVIEGIQHLDELATQQGYSVGQVDLADRAVTAWTQLSTVPSSRRQTSSQVLQASVAGAHVQVGNYEILASSLAALEAALQANDQSVLTQADFGRAIANLDTPNDGYVYLNWPSLKQRLAKRSPLFQVLDSLAQPLTNHLESVTLSTYGRDRNRQPSGIFLHLTDE
ncbi:MAG: DUF3352 domain-containing protein [Thainema sp.]